jgi:L-lysine 6-transaminase
VAKEAHALTLIEQAFDDDPWGLAAILIEPIQAEGGDHHFRSEFLVELRRISDERDAMLIFDEVQTGGGITGKWWAFEHFGVTPDIVCFAKKLQIGGILVSRRVEQVPGHVFETPNRINSTWGGSLSDMVRATRILELVTELGLLDNAAARGAELLAGLHELEARHRLVTQARGRGLMCAFDLPTPDVRNALVRVCFEQGMLVLPCGERSIRLRPTLDIGTEHIAEGLGRIDTALCRVLKGVTAAGSAN